MSRQRKPVELLKLAGTARKCRVEAQMQEFRPKLEALGPPPDWLDPEAKAEWHQIATHPDYSKIIGGLHRSVFTEYCCLHAKMIKAARSPKTCKLTSVERQTLTALRRELGLTPVSATRLKQPKSNEPSGSVWDKLQPPPGSSEAKEKSVN